ncbi:SGNH/GDSL hydrolase family protein [Aquibium oceanicum]|uniref:SGNH/GDSL hydrolase family protein n=1 Tax=Aquibium oceanicum TaxID=1670800 RepID=UPI0009F8217E|nr:DUF459 domain-containing protein [Aquibium oceanicum]
MKSPLLRKWTGLCLALAIIASAAAVVTFLGSVSEAQAQERPRTLFQLLFPNRREESRPAAREPQPRQKKRTPPARAEPREATPAPAAASAPPPPADVEKAGDARPLLVVGDFLAGGLAEGLETVFEDDPTVRIVDRSNGSSGFVRNDFYDWPGKIGDILDEVKPAVAVVMIGSNDRQVMGIGSSTEPVRSDRWATEYEARATMFASAFSSRGIPLVWVGLPSFKFSKMSSDMIAFNDIHRRAAEAASGVFVDIWDGFVDENGAFVTNGPDINGQPVRLRANDGINLTQAGRRKIAFYAEKPLAHILEDGSPGVSPDGEIGEMFGPPIPGSTPVIQHTTPVSLTDPELDGGDELLGLVVVPRRDNALTPAQKLVIEGLAPDPRPGRVDDFGRSSLPEAAPDEGDRTSALPERPETGTAVTEDQAARDVSAGSQSSD